MENCYNEFISHINESAKQKVICAKIMHDRDYLGGGGRKFVLKIGYTPAAYEDFLKSLNFDYDSGYGGQELFGTIWYADGTWSSRGEYDGSEWWEYNKCPDIPQDLKEGASNA